MVAVGLDDKLAGGGEVGVLPSSKEKLVAERGDWLEVERGEVSGEVEAPGDVETSLFKQGGMGTVGVKEKLGFDAFDARGVGKQIDDVFEESGLDLPTGVAFRGVFPSVAWAGEDVSDDGFVFLVDTEDIADDAGWVLRGIDGDEPWEGSGVKILEEKSRRSHVVPVEPGAPEAALSLEYGAECV